jgi:pimeloyl-ACP methyl ester carboxylesterase
MTLLAVAVVWFIPGWLRTDEPAQDVLACATRAFPGASVEFKSWDGDNVLWPSAVANADKEAWRFAFEIATMERARRENLTLVGHSLGGRILARVLARLSEKNLRIRQAVLLGAAIPADDADLKKMGRATRQPVLALCNPADVTLRYVYATVGGEGAVAFGANGALTPCENVVECVTPTNVTDEVDIDAIWGRFPAVKRIANHSEKFYMAYARRLLQGEAPSDAIMVPQGLPTLEGPVADSGVWWEMLEEAAGWKLEKNKVTGHCRILSPGKCRKAWGAEAQMRAAFEKVKFRLPR